MDYATLYSSVEDRELFEAAVEISVSASDRIISGADFPRVVDRLLELSVVIKEIDKRGIFKARGKTVT